MVTPLNTTKKRSFKEIAEEINKHLLRFQADPKINKDRSGKGLRAYFNAGAWYTRGSRMSIVYISYQGRSSLTKEQAEKYLEKLDAGFVGRHFEALRG